MEKTARAELIASLVTDRYSGFKDGDEALLEAASDVRLEEFRTASQQRAAAASEHTRLESDNRQVNARLKVAEERIRVAEQPMTKDEFLLKAPPEFKALLENHAALEAATKTALVSLLKDCGANTEDELTKMTVPELKQLAKYARVEIPDFSGRGVPLQRSAENNQTDYTPPDSYGIAITKEKAAQKTVTH